MSRRKAWRKPSGNGPNPSGLAWRLVGYSVLVWCLLGLLALVFFTDPRVTSTFHLAFFDSFEAGVYTLTVAFAIVLLNILAGALCAVPAVVFVLLGRRQTEFVQRKSNRLRRLQRIIGSAFPYAVLGAANVLMISLGFGSAPQWARALTRDSNPLADYSRFVNEFFFYPAENESTKDAWKQALSGQDAPQAVVLFAPSTLLFHAAGLPKISRALGRPYRFFADSPSAPAFFAELFDAEESANLAFHLPVPDEFAQKAMARFLPQNGQSLGVHWNDSKGTPENLVARFSPEWRAVGRALQGDKETARSLLLRKTANAHRLLQSQVHLFLLARYNVFQLVEPHAQWMNLVADDRRLLDESLEEIAARRKNGLKGGLVFLQLSELERATPDARAPFSPLRWPEGLSPSEQRWLVNKWDNLLGFGFSVTAAQGPSYFVVPYPDGSRLRSQLTSAFARAKSGEDVTSGMPAKVLGGFLTVDDIAVALRTSAVGRNNSGSSSFQSVKGGGSADVGSATDVALDGTQAAGLHCERHFADLSSMLSDENVPRSRIQESYWNAVGRYSNDVFQFPSALSFLSGSGFEHSVICRPTRDADAKSFDTSQSWIVRWVRQEESDIVFSAEGGAGAAGEGELRRALVKSDAFVSSARGSRLSRESGSSGGLGQSVAARRATHAALDARRASNYELFRLALDIQAGMVLRRATQVESLEFFRRWGDLVDGQFEQGARAQLH